MAAIVPTDKAWSALRGHYEQVSKLHLRQMFAGDASRAERMTIGPW